MYINLLKSARKVQVVRYLVSGLLTVLTEYLSFVILHDVLENLLIANSVSLVIALLVNFVLNRYFVFNSSGNLNSQLGLYVIVFFINVVISGFVITLVSSFGVSIFIAKFIAMSFSLTWIYIAYKKVVFKNRERIIK